MFCLGCGLDLSSKPKDRRNLSQSDFGVLSSWIKVFEKEMGMMISYSTVNIKNPGKMCKKCYYYYDKYHKLFEELQNNFHIAINKLL